MRFWRSESDQQTPPTECIGCRATGGRAGIPRCVAESRWGEKRGRPWSSCRRLSRSSWPAMAILTWAGGCRGCRRSSVVGVGRMLSMSKERGASQGEHVFLGVVCCRSLASHGANKSTMRRPGNRAHAPGPTVATKSFNSKLGSGPHSSSISSTRDEGILLLFFFSCQTPLLQAFVLHIQKSGVMTPNPPRWSFSPCQQG